MLLNVMNMMRLDWIGMKEFRNRILVHLACLIILGLISGGAFVIPLAVYCMYDFASYTFDAEEKGKLHHLYLTLPVSRRTIISAKYGLSLFMQFIGIISGIAIALVFSVISLNGGLINILPLPFQLSFSADFQSIALLSCVGLLLCAFFSLCSYPLVLRLGYAKAKIFGWYVPTIAGIVLFIVLFNVYVNSEGFRELANSAFAWALSNTALLALAMLGATAALLALSYALSQRAYSKREF